MGQADDVQALQESNDLLKVELENERQLRRQVEDDRLKIKVRSFIFVSECIRLMSKSAIS